MVTVGPMNFDTAVREMPSIVAKGGRRADRGGVRSGGGFH